MPAELGPAGPRDPLRAIYEREQQRGPTRRRFYAIASAVLVLGAFAAIIYYAYYEGIRAGSESVSPLIRADQQPYKVKPDEPGGMEIPNQDKLIYNEVSPDRVVSGKQQVERLMPPPESPLPKPSPEQQSAQQQPRPPQQNAQSPAASAIASASSPQQVRPPGTPAYVPLPPAPANVPPVDQVVGQQQAQPPAETASTTTAALSGAWRVQLGSVRSSNEAQHEWARLQKQHLDLLGGLTLSVQRADLGGAKGVFYRIQGGPLPDREVADALCGRLKAVRVGCLAVKP